MSAGGETIFALATAPGRAGVAVVRVSGPQSWDGLAALARIDNPAQALSLPATGNALCKIYSLYAPDQNVSRETIDHAMVLVFQNPKSFTGEDVVEYHIHGGRAVTDSLLAALATLPGHRMALPGEFTRRAFENGKMDLTEAEAIADLVDAETQAQKMQALSQMGGALSTLYARWTEELKKTLAHMEADIEFPDEDLPDGIAPELTEKVKSLLSELEDHLNDNRRGERLRDGLQVAIIGAPNAGKSSLINALAQRDVAIVSDMAGTTRDVIEVHLDLGGFPIVLADTAGLRPEQIDEKGHDAIESEGIRRALSRAQNADIKLLLFDGTEEKPNEDTLALRDDNAIVVLNKADEKIAARLPCSAIPVSAKTGKGLDDLIAALIDKAKDMIGSAETPSLTRQRHRTALEEARNHLRRALSADLPELMAEDLRLAIRYLGRITGRVDVEDLLDVIFKDFCIGK